MALHGPSWVQNLLQPFLVPAFRREPCKVQIDGFRSASVKDGFACIWSLSGSAGVGGFSIIPIELRLKIVVVVLRN